MSFLLRLLDPDSMSARSRLVNCSTNKTIEVTTADTFPRWSALWDMVARYRIAFCNDNAVIICRVWIMDRYIIWCVEFFCVINWKGQNKDLPCNYMATLDRQAKVREWSSASRKILHHCANYMIHIQKEPHLYYSMVDGRTHAMSCGKHNVEPQRH
jgi:hypothetical protein